MKSIYYDIAQLSKKLGAPLPSHSSDLPRAIREDELEMAYYTILIDDIEKRKIIASNDRSRKKLRIREHNAPKDVTYEPDSHEYSSKVVVEGYVLEIPSCPDPDEAVRRRDLVQHFVNQHVTGQTTEAKARIERVQHILSSFHQFQTNKALADEGNALIGRPEELQRPSVPQNRQKSFTSTPIKPSTSVSSAHPSTPLTVPHRVDSRESDTDFCVLKFRDKYYCRFIVFSEAISTPMRRTKMEAFNDKDRMSARVKSYQAMINNPLTKSSQSQMDKIVHELTSFSESLDGSSPPNDSLTGTPNISSNKRRQLPQTEMKKVSSLSDLALPEGVYRVRDKFYSSVNVFGKTISTPLRDSKDDAGFDKEFFLSEASKRNAVEDKSKAIEEIKYALGLQYELRTPRKSIG